MPAHLQFQNGGEVVALVPTRYPGTETSSDDALRLARKTIWQEVGEDAHHGVGQRVLATDADETPLMDVRSITLEPALDDGTDAETDDTADA